MNADNELAIPVNQYMLDKLAKGESVEVRAVAPKVFGSNRMVRIKLEWLPERSEKK